MQLTKSLFLSYLDCPLHMWLHSRGVAAQEDSVFAKHIKEQGYIVEEYAKAYLKLLVEQQYSPGSQLQFEVTLTDGKHESRIDALIYDTEANVYDLYEIKSSTDVHREHVYDVTFQSLVAAASLNVRHVYLLHLNREYVREGELALSELFTIEEMDKRVERLREEVEELRQEVVQLLRQSEPPTEMHCYKPNDCPYPEQCFPKLQEYSIYDLGHTSRKQYQELIALGVKKLAEIPETFALSDKQHRQVHATMLQQPIIDKEAIHAELSRLKYPLFFVDYETFQEGIPRFDGYRSYQQAVTQFSLHVSQSETAAKAGEFDHYEYLAMEQSDPACGLARALCSAIGETGTVIVWNKDFECGRNEELAVLCPEYATQLRSINARTYDLMDIFAKGYYIDYRFKGSASIKKVLPVLCPDLSYNGLTIGEGTTAMLGWYEMVYGDVSEERREELKQDLLAYCKLDTWAMVEIWRRVGEVAG